MSRYLIKFTRKRAWDILPLGWLENGQVQCDPITDLRSMEGKLSVWEVEDDRSNLDLVILGLACTRQGFELVDYGLFDPSIVEALGISVEPSAGETPVPEANKCHRDLAELTVTSLAELVNRIFFSIEKDRKLEAEIKKLVLEAWEHEIDQEKVPKRLKEAVQGELAEY